MKIVVCVKTRNESANIERFCRSYQWADRIVVADGSSEDNTVELAKQFPNVEVHDFPFIIEFPGGHLRTPEGRHMNFLFQKANALKPDWIIFDDCDCFPNRLLREQARSILESTDDVFLGVTRLYLWGDKFHFPALAKPSGDWSPSAWAWRSSLGVDAQDTVAHFTLQVGGIPLHLTDIHMGMLMPPYCLLHCPWPTLEATDKKLALYRESGLVPDMLHPLEFGGKLDYLPEWAQE